MNYTFENALPKTCAITYDYTEDKTTVEYNNGRVYNVHIDFESGSYNNEWYQYANGDGYFFLVLTVTVIPVSAAESKSEKYIATMTTEDYDRSYCLSAD